MCIRDRMYDPDGRSGRGELGTTMIDNKQTKTITVTQRLLVYGNASNDKLAKTIAEKVQSSWNAAKAKIRVDAKGKVVEKGGTEYLVVFDVKAETVTEEKAAELRVQADTHYKHAPREQS